MNHTTTLDRILAGFLREVAECRTRKQLEEIKGRASGLMHNLDFNGERLIEAVRKKEKSF